MNLACVGRRHGLGESSRWAASLLALIVTGGLSTVHLQAQSQGSHPLYNDRMPPGAIGSWQLQRGGPLAGYFQPVEIKAPEGALVSLAVGGEFDTPRPAPRRVGLEVGAVYRLAVVNIPLQEGRDIYPTLEVIDRLYPPCGQEANFPIPVELTAQELRMALDGHYVQRVIYLEDGAAALPADFDDQQPWFEVGQGEDALATADVLGRPVAILRLGGRVPTGRDGDTRFYGSGRPFVNFTVRRAGVPSEFQPATR